MLEQFRALMQKKSHMVIGLMSGTSVDGVDAALCEIAGERRGNLKVALVAEHSEPYPDFLREKILAASDPQGGSSAEICELNFLLGEAFAHTVNALIDVAKIKNSDVDLIGSHGQTISHIPPRTEAQSFQLGSTLQIAEAAVIAERTGIMVVSNFRPRDMAAGGQGAPLVPFVDYLLFSNDSQTRVMLNIGGISNVTYLPAGGLPEDTLAYDSGPGNMIIDAMIQQLTQGEQSYDKDGAIAASGSVHDGLLAEMLKHKYLRRQPPKSTGREEFGVDYATKMYAYGVKQVTMTRDIIATATAFTAATISQSLNKFVLPRGPVDEIVVSGGGAFNPELMRHLRKELPGLTIKTSDEYGLPPKSKESICFAVLARETILGRPGNLPSATGASGPRILGQITPA